MLANHHAPALNDSPQGDSDLACSDYDIILTALTESARGRLFLEEHARRNRVTETATLLTAIGRIESLLDARSLEPAALPAAEGIQQSEAAPSAVDATPALEAAETLDVDVFEADTAVNENNVPGGEDHEVVVSSATADIEIVSLESAAIDAPAIEASAIEFLGPQPLPADLPDEPQPIDVVPQAETARQRSPDPFADIRALSDEEKIALFA